MDKLEFFIGWVEKSTIVIAGVCVFGIMLVTSTDVIKRYMLGSALGWAYHVSCVLLVWIVFIALAQITKEGGHIQFGLVYLRLTGRIRRAAQVLHNIVGFLVFALIGWQSVDYSIMSLREGHLYAPEWPVSVTVAWIAIAFGSFLVCLRFVLSLVKPQDFSKVAEDLG